jgi:hypothetical protein
VRQVANPVSSRDHRTCLRWVDKRRRTLGFGRSRVNQIGEEGAEFACDREPRRPASHSETRVPSDEARHDDAFVWSASAGGRFRALGLRRRARPQPARRLPRSARFTFKDPGPRLMPGTTVYGLEQVIAVTYLSAISYTQPISWTSCRFLILPPAQDARGQGPLAIGAGIHCQGSPPSVNIWDYAPRARRSSGARTLGGRATRRRLVQRMGI